MTEPYTTKSFLKYVNEKPKPEEGAISLIRYILSDKFVVGKIIKVRGYERIDKSWTVEGRQALLFRENEMGICRGDLVWYQIEKLMADSGKMFKASRSYHGYNAIMTIWRVY